MFHSDRGSQYASGAMSAKLTAYDMTASMSRKGNCWDTQSKINSSTAFGQCAHGKFLQQFEERAGARYDLCNAGRRAGRSVRVHRGVLQPEAPPLHARLQLASSVPRELDQQACCSAIPGGISATRWKTKFDGHLRTKRRLKKPLTSASRATTSLTTTGYRMHSQPTTKTPGIAAHLPASGASHEVHVLTRPCHWHRRHRGHHCPDGMDCCQAMEIRTQITRYRFPVAPKN